MAVLMVVLLLTTLNNASVLQDMLSILLNAMVCKPAPASCTIFNYACFLLDINECSMFNPCEQVVRTNDSIGVLPVCSCRNGFSLKSDEFDLSSVCKMYLIVRNYDKSFFLNSQISMSVCRLHSMVAVYALLTVNVLHTRGSYQCDCVPGPLILLYGTCHSMLHFATYSKHGFHFC